MKWTEESLIGVQKAVKVGKSRAIIAEELNIPVNTVRGMIQAVNNVDAIKDFVAPISDVVKAEDNVSNTRAELNRARKEIKRLVRRIEINSELDDSKLSIPKWVQKEPTSHKSFGTLCTILSDTHFDEVVNPEEVNFCNEYNREIATQRLRNYFHNLILLDTKYIAGVRIEGVMLAMAGDMVSGNIHEELTITNHGSIIDTVLYWSGEIIAGLRLLLEHFKNVMVNCVVGNHGRTSPKLRFKGATVENWDYLLYKMIGNHFADTPGIEFNIPTSTQMIFPVYNTVYGLHHGMDFRGGFGDAGAVVPMIRGNRRKREFQTQIGNPYDILLMGHFHQLMRLPTVISNGSMIGYNEYALRGSFPFEQPQQACWITDPKRGAQQPFFPIFCDR